MAEIELRLGHKEDTLVIRAEAVEEIFAVMPMLANAPQLQRFFTSSFIGETLSAPAVKAKLATDPPTPTGPADPTAGPKRGTVKKVTAADVLAGGKKKSSRYADLADESDPAGAGLLLLVKTRTGQEPAAGISVAEAKALLKEVK